MSAWQASFCTFAGLKVAEKKLLVDGETAANGSADLRERGIDRVYT